MFLEKFPYRVKFYTKGRSAARVQKVQKVQKIQRVVVAALGHAFGVRVHRVQRFQKVQRVVVAAPPQVL